MSTNRTRRKKKISIRKVSIFIFTVILLVCLFIFRRGIIYFIQSKITGYDYDTIKYAHKYDIFKDVKRHKYSDTFDKIINTKQYNNKYYKYYLDTKYIDSNDYFKDINTLFDIGYNSNDVNNIYEVLDDDDINILIKTDYFKDISNILQLSYFKKYNLSRYLEYANKNKLDAKDIVTYVNIGLDNEYYSNITKIKDPSDLLVLVNKYNFLDSNYIPNDLESISSKYNVSSNNKLRHIAKERFEYMCESALKDNIKIYNGSAFRSYNYQLNLYNNYVRTDGKIKAETYAARAGYSEHQTGLALDIMNEKRQFISSGDKEYDWLVNNSYKYGFILRYPKEKENITGYMYEEWHFRYVGKDIAKIIYDEDITYDEYVARQ